MVWACLNTILVFYCFSHSEYQEKYHIVYILTFYLFSIYLIGIFALPAMLVCLLHEREGPPPPNHQRMAVAAHRHNPGEAGGRW
jgi:hypothetical protein